MKNLTKLEDLQIEETFEKLGYCLAVEDIKWTAESVDQILDGFKNQGYNPTAKSDKHFEIENFQKAKGSPRQTVVCFDFGEVRGVTFN